MKRRTINFKEKNKNSENLHVKESNRITPKKTTRNLGVGLLRVKKLRKAIIHFLVLEPGFFCKKYKKYFSGLFFCINICSF